MYKLAPRSTDATRADNRRRMQSHAVAVALTELGRQLVIAAGLTRSWLNGADECAGWSPGCGEVMP